MVGATASAKKLLERGAKALREAEPPLLGDDDGPSLSDIVSTLVASASALNEDQAAAWARACSDITLDRGLAIQALDLGILPALPRFLQRFTDQPQQSVSWADCLMALHNFSLLEDGAMAEALQKLPPSDLTAIATNLVLALKPGLHPSEARDASSRLAVYDLMMPVLIDSGVLAALAQFIPNVKPLNRLSLWGAEALREINHSLAAMDLLLFMYTKTEREKDLPAKELASSSLTGWICDVLHGASSPDPRVTEEVEQSRISALECLTSLLINAAVCRMAVPINRSMLFRVASAITSTSSIQLLSAAAQVLAQALSEEDLVQPSELASLHTYDLVRHLSQVIEESRDFRDLLNVTAALQNILDPAHFKDNMTAMKKVAERLVACSFEEQMAAFLKNPRDYFDMPEATDDGTPVYPSPDDYEALVEAAKGAQENTRLLMEAVGPITGVTVLPRPAPRQRPPASGASGKGKEKEKSSKEEKAGKGDKEKGGSARKAAQNVPADVIAAVTGGKEGGGSGRGKRKQKDKDAGEAGTSQAEGSGRRGSKRQAADFPLADRVQLEKDMRRAATLAAPLLSASPMHAVLDWFNEWGTSTERLAKDLGTDVHVPGGSHRTLLLDALEAGDPGACLNLLVDILQVKLPPLKDGVAPPPKQQAKAGGTDQAAVAAPSAAAPETAVEDGAGAGVAPMQPEHAAGFQGVADGGAAPLDGGDVHMQQQ